MQVHLTGCVSSRKTSRVPRDKDTKAPPTGGIRQIPYKLKVGEAGWVLKPDQTVDY